jgi:hypothetical protein
MKKMQYLVVGIIFIVILSLLVMRVDKGYLPIPIWIRHIANSLLIDNDKLYRPIKIDSCEIFTRSAGYSKVYALEPEYLDIYEIGLVNKKDGFHENYKFNGIFKVSFYYHNDLVLEKIVDKMDQAWFKEGTSDYKQIALCKFNIPFANRYKDGISVSITIIRPDYQLKKYCDSSELYIAVSPTP